MEDMSEEGMELSYLSDMKTPIELDEKKCANFESSVNKSGAPDSAKVHHEFLTFFQMFSVFCQNSILKGIALSRNL